MPSSKNKKLRTHTDRDAPSSGSEYAPSDSDEPEEEYINGGRGGRAKRRRVLVIDSIKQTAYAKEVPSRRTGFSHNGLVHFNKMMEATSDKAFFVALDERGAVQRARDAGSLLRCDGEEDNAEGGEEGGEEDGEEDGDDDGDRGGGRRGDLEVFQEWLLSRDDDDDDGDDDGDDGDGGDQLMRRKFYASVTLVPRKQDGDITHRSSGLAAADSKCVLVVDACKQTCHLLTLPTLAHTFGFVDEAVAHLRSSVDTKKTFTICNYETNAFEDPEASDGLVRMDDSDEHEEDGCSESSMCTLANWLDMRGRSGYDAYAIDVTLNPGAFSSSSISGVISIVEEV